VDDRALLVTRQDLNKHSSFDQQMSLGKRKFLVFQQLFTFSNCAVLLGCSTGFSSSQIGKWKRYLKTDGAKDVQIKAQLYQ
jgi:hypothetical protein